MDNHLATREAWRLAVTDVEQQPNGTRLVLHLAYLYRGSCSLEQAPESLSHDPSWVRDPGTGILVRVEDVRSIEDDRWLSPPASDPIPARAHELLDQGQLPAKVIDEIIREITWCSRRCAGEPSLEGRIARREVVAWMDTVKSHLAAGGVLTKAQVRQLNSRLHKKPLDHTSIVVKSHQWIASRESHDDLRDQPAHSAFDLLLMMLPAATATESSFVVTNVTSALGSSNPARGALWQMVGLHVRGVFQYDHALLNHLILPLALEGPWDVPETLGDSLSGAQWRQSRSEDRASYVSGLLMARRSLPAELGRVHARLIRWFFDNVRHLPHSDSTNPADIVEVLAKSILADGFTGGDPDPGSRGVGSATALLDAVPPLAVAAALQTFFRTEKLPPFSPEARSFFQDLWLGVRRWADQDSDRADVLAVMSMWATRPAAILYLGLSFVVSELHECLHEQASIHSATALLAALAQHVHDEPDNAEPILLYVLDLQKIGLLQGCRGESAVALLDALGKILGSGSVTALRNKLTSDRVLHLPPGSRA